MSNSSLRHFTFMLAVLGFGISLISTGVPELQAGEFRAKAWKKYRGTRIYMLQDRSAYSYVTGFMTIDADGAPNAYHPNNSGLDDLANAGYPRHSWWNTVLVPDPADGSRPYIMKSGPYAGYYISMTTLKDLRYAETDSRRYVDASRIPYIVFPETFAAMDGVGQIGDYGVAVNLDNGSSSGFVVADIGPRRHPLGEISIALATRLGGKDVSARTGPAKPLGQILYIVFPGSASRHPWPRDLHAIESITQNMLVNAGGAGTLSALAGYRLPAASARALPPGEGPRGR
ncbi:glycoside hydrolase family 75 protein [Pelodictyon luteolum]|uniref:Uncharacterized protein n=1 Tax=Chlorobium luteolum (strain DSM 273 / BCRC 81028 / 2530) TaxID=319225 RepID=Q3B485_CHLL3|nr:glycoside hydrolase family 75 protein [Pelodictyon luteolum]ABB23846.1 hypothetical protein Plut_0984 [Pelodictyon luteolum DSM 273]